MTTTNKPMTGEQLDELMTVSVNMQRESEKLGDRSAAMFAYAVQVAVLELRSVRKVVEQLAAENAYAKKIIGECREFFIAGVMNRIRPTNEGYLHMICDTFADETPATDAFLAEVRASAIPEGYVLVPQEMHLPSETMEGICFHCGDGNHQFGEFTDGTLFVGEVDYGDGNKVHGLHIATADYPEEGCTTICEFAAQLRQEVTQ